MNRIIKFFGSLTVSAAALTALTVTSYADTSAITAPTVTGFNAELADDGTIISWDKIDNSSYIFLFRKTADSLSCIALLPAGTDSYVDIDAPDDTCVYFLQTDVTVNGTVVLCSSNKVTAAASPAAEVSAELNAGLTIDNGKATVSWNKTNASGYIITMDGNTVFDTGSEDITSYTVTGLANYSKHTFTVSSYSDSNGTRTVLEESEPMITTSLDTILNSARTSSTRSFNVINRQTGVTSVSGKSLSDHDIAVIEKFAAEHFTDDMSDAQKLQTALTWINRNVKYASTSADWSMIGNKSYADAIFTYQRGQCAQYNGAMVSLMRYLGYDADLVLGWRGNSYSRWQHYWGEVEIDGLRFLIETGNYGSSGTWSYLLVPYSRADGRFIMYG